MLSTTDKCYSGILGNRFERSGEISRRNKCGLVEAYESDNGDLGTATSWTSTPK